MSDTPTPQPILLDVMLDLETMGNGPDAAIMAIGAVLFDPIQGTKGANYYAVIDLQSSVNNGGVIDASTVMWWLAQHVDARMALVEADTKLHLCAALADFADWIDIHSDRRRVRMWGNGAAFDNVILASAYRRAGIPQPWRYNNDRCYRTVKAQHPDVLMKREGTHHNAIDDARSQAQHLINMLSAQVLMRWQPIETAPQTGNTLLLGCFNSHGKWRTMRGQWMSADYISEYFEDPDSAEPGWFETCVEADELPNCWPIRPTHWMPLPAAPTAPAAVPLTEADAAHDYGVGAPVAPVDGLTS